MTIEHDLEQKDVCLRYLRERSLDTLSARFNMTPQAIWWIEKRPAKSLTAQQNAEIKRLRTEYHRVKNEDLPKYWIGAIAWRHGASGATVSARKRAMIENKAQAVYEQRIAA